MTPSRSFASDNNSGIHPDVLKAIEAANVGHVPGYGDDPYTQEALRKFRETFGEGSETYFVFNGTGANVAGLTSITRPFHSILCSDLAHINVDECGAPEKFTGCKVIPVQADREGKLTPAALLPHCKGFGAQHHSQPKVISISQVTEVGTVYAPAEIQRLANFAHERGMLLHMDGARLSNAAASLRVPLEALTRDVGVDILSFGGTKNGLLGAEAVVFFKPELARDFAFHRKQAMQLASKMRFISAQLSALLTDELWLRNAAHANRMASLLAEKVSRIPRVEITRPVQANGVFAKVPREAIERLQKKYFFFVWDEYVPEVRWMTSFDTRETDVEDFSKEIEQALG